MRNTRYPGHFSGFTCECCFRKLPRSEFYLPQERVYLKHCRSCTAAQQKKSRQKKAA